MSRATPSAFGTSPKWDIEALYEYKKYLVVPFGGGRVGVEQRAIVGRLEALSAETGRLEEIYQQKVESLEELRRVLLGKAFGGEL